MYDIGDDVTLEFDILDGDGDPVDPATVTLTLTAPDGTSSTPSPTHAGVGRYTYTHPAAAAGRHWVRWVATDPGVAFTDAFDVSSGAEGILSLRVGKEHLQLDADDTTYDEQVRNTIAGVTGVMEDLVGALVRRTHVEKHDGGRPAIALNHSPVLSITTVTESGTTLAATDYSLDDYGVLTRVSGYTARRWCSGVNNIVVTLVAGASVIRPHFLTAALDLLRINFRPIQGGNYTPFDTPEGGDSTQGLWRLGFFVPRGVLSLLGGDVRPPGMA